MGVVGLSFVLQLLTNPRAMAKARKARKARRRRSLLPRVQVPWLNQLGKNRPLMSRMMNKPARTCVPLLRRTYRAMARCCSVLARVFLLSGSATPGLLGQFNLLGD